MTEARKSIQQKTAKAPTVSDMLETASEESGKVQSMLKMAWVCCMNMSDGRHYDFDPDKSDMQRNYEELQSIIDVIDECVHKLESLDETIERAQRAAMNRKES